MRKILRGILNILLFPFRLIQRFFRSISKAGENVQDFFTDEPEDHPLGDTLDAVSQEPQVLLEHIYEFRHHLIRSVIYLAITTAFAFIYAEEIIDWLARPIGGISRLNPIDVTEPISVFMKVSLLTGFTVALPFIAFELWRFFAPGLRPRARIGSFLAIPVTVILFLTGMAFAYFVLLPTALPFLLNFLGMTPQIRPASYIGFTTGILFWIGIAFQFPLVIFILASLNLIRAQTLLNQWRLAVVIIAILSAAITPTLDPVNMALVMGPMIVLYFLSIGLAYLAQGKETNPEPQPEPEE
jgi:sec-independent protein translocase protein TatC